MAQEAQPAQEKFVGIQISPLSFMDEGVEPLLDTLKERFGINVLLIGTISWLGLKVGRRVSWKLDGWPDHGTPEAGNLKGGSYIADHPEYYGRTFIRNFRSHDRETEGVDILERVIPAAKERGMQVYAEVMEPLFNYANHGSAQSVNIPNLPQVLEVDVFGRFGTEPCINNPDYRRWWYSIIEDYCKNYEIDGVMWCNERRSPFDNMIAGKAPQCFCEHDRRAAAERGIDAERCRQALLNVYDYFQRARAGEPFVDGSMIEFLRVLYNNPEAMVWEKYWVERNKDMDRELYGLVKFCRRDLKFGLNVWNRNHFNPIRRAQWPWGEMTMWSDWVKPITYQHQSGLNYVNEMLQFHRSILRDVTPEEMTPVMYKLLGFDEAPWGELVERGLDPDTYVAGQCADAVRGVGGKIPVYMGIGVDAPRTRADQARCTPDIVRRSVLATYRAGGAGVVYSPNYAGMDHTTLDGGAAALRELGLL